MKRFQATVVTLLTVPVLLAATGCWKHKPNLPPQAQAPAVTEPPPQPAPASPSAATPAPAPASTDSGTVEPAPKPPKTPPRTPHPTPRKPAPVNDKPPAVETAKVLPPKIVIQQGGTSDAVASAAITPLLSHDDAAHSQASTAQLMESTERNIAGIKRQLSADETAVSAQIQDYMAQSRQATKDGDLTRARNLALKAHLLSDELAKPR